MNPLTRTNRIGNHLGIASMILLAASVPTSMAGQNIAAGISLAAALLFLWPLKKEKLPCEPSLCPLLLMLILVLISIPFSIYPNKSLGKFPEIELWLIFIFFVPMIFIRTRKLFTIVTGVVIAAAVTAAVYSFVQIATFAGPPDPGDPVGYRPSGFFSFYLTFANVMGMTAVILWGIALSGKWNTRRMLAAAGAGLLITALILSKSRGPFIAMALSVSAVALLRIRSRKGLFVFLALILAAAGTIFIVPSLRARFFSIFNFSKYHDFENNYAIADRLTRWHIGWNMIREHPVLGVGYGIFATCMPVFNTTGHTIFPSHAHSIYVNIAAESGLPSCLCLITTFFLLLRKFFLDDRRFSNPLGICFFGLVIYYAAAGLTEEVWSDAESFNAFWFLAGLGAACSRLFNQTPVPQTDSAEINTTPSQG